MKIVLNEAEIKEMVRDYILKKTTEHPVFISEIRMNELCCEDTIVVGDDNTEIEVLLSQESADEH